MKDVSVTFCTCFQESYPDAWPGENGRPRDANQAAKSLRSNMTKIVADHRRHVTFTNRSG